MYDNYNYPEGADTPDAPWNQCDPDPVDFELDICYSLTKSVTITSDNYTGGYRDEEGYYERPDYEGDPQKDYECEHFTPLEIMEEYSLYCMKQLKELESKTIQELTREQVRQRDHYRKVIASCDGWEEEFERV